ncbi:NAD(P)-dependent alcohol dehydrogenase [Lonepinella sp. BR2271]|uniref:NAD(P)-dependent alcohol dehydrogenase n=1 Tax=Lonepinella sp. BR2271 TaxID=3434550 RepID=UPI003F6DEBB9
MMTYTVKGFAAIAADQPLVPFNVPRRALRADDVQIDILYTGVCHSDLHMARNDWGNSVFPIVPGHEIVGRVKAVGSAVSKFKAGDLVGVGCLVDSCRECSPCQHHLEQFCEQGATMTYGGQDRHNHSPTYGGYAKEIVVSDAFVLSVPENLDTKAVPPILCAGITTWSPLRRWNVGKGSKVAVVGLGGLGHMAIKLAKALGAEVSLFTRSPEKSQDALRLGASQIIVSTDKAQMKSVYNQFDLIIDTVPYQHDVNPYMPTLAIDGTLVFVGLIGQHPELSTVPLVMGRRSIAGSLIGGIQETQELLDFCGEHNIVSDIEMINMADINNAYERMLKSDVKYRFVIDIAKSL